MSTKVDTVRATEQTILSIDTSGAFASVAIGQFSPLAQNGVVLASCDGVSNQSHSEELDSLIQRCLSEAGISVDDGLDGIVLGKGPGSFTGLRIGFAMVQGLALVRKLPVYLLPSALGVDSDIVLAPAGKGLVFESVRGSFAQGETGTVSPMITCEIKGCGDVNLSTATNGRETLRALAQIPEFPDLLLANEVAAGLLKRFFLHPSHFTGIQNLAELEPDYVRAVAAKTIAERISG